MSLNEAQAIGKSYRVCADPINNEWRKYSFWTSANDVEMVDNRTLQELIDRMSPDALGAVKNATNATEAVHAIESDWSQNSDLAIKAVDVENLGSGVLDTITVIDGDYLVTSTIKNLIYNSDEQDTSDLEENNGSEYLVEPIVISRETVTDPDLDLKLGDNFALIAGKINANFAQLRQGMGKMRGMSIATHTLSAENWTDEYYYLNSVFPPSKGRVIVEPDGDYITSEEYEAWINAGIVNSGTTNTLRAYGIIPTVDIPVIVYIINSTTVDPDDDDDDTPIPVVSNDYNDLINKPSINNIPLQGNLILSILMDEDSRVTDLDIQSMVTSAFED